MLDSTMATGVSVKSSEANQEASERPTVYVGLDYHQNSVQVCVMDASANVLANRGVANDWLKIVSVVPKDASVQASIESCTGASALAEQLIELAGWSVSLAHPGYVNRMKQTPDKSDYSDAKVLADLVRVGYLPKVWLAPTSLRELRDLVRYRQQLADERRRIKQRIRALLRNHRIKCPHAQVNPWTKGWLSWLKEDAGLSDQSRWVMDQHLLELTHTATRIHAAEKRLREATAGDTRVAYLMRQPGIGEVTAWVMRAEIGRFDRFASGKQLSRFCGLSPRNASSGERKADGGLIKASNKMLRAMLIEAAHRLRRNDPTWAAFSDRLEQAGKPVSVIAAAVGNRWIRQLYYDMKELEQAA